MSEQNEIPYDMNDYYRETDEYYAKLGVKMINNVLKGVNMSKMPYIAKLAEEGNLKELIEEVGSEDVAQGFIDAVKEKVGAEPYPEYDKEKGEYKYPKKNKSIITSIGYRGEE